MMGELTSDDPIPFKELCISYQMQQGLFPNISNVTDQQIPMMSKHVDPRGLELSHDYTTINSKSQGSQLESFISIHMYSYSLHSRQLGTPNVRPNIEVSLSRWKACSQLKTRIYLSEISYE